MNLASGNGSVTVKNVTVFVSGTEKLAAIKHKNGNDVWILTHDWNNNKFRANLLSISGFSLNPIVSSVGTVISLSQGGIASNLGQMKVSPDGKKVGLAIYNTLKAFELYDFDSSTGIVSNPIILGNNFGEAYGCEFSPDGTKFYGGGWSIGTIWQWDLCAGSNLDIIASQQVVNTNTTIGIASMQLAPNGKIYVVKVADSILGVINTPNSKGITCNYIHLGQSVAPNTAVYGLPNFTSNFFWSGPTLFISSSTTNSMCVGETLTLTASGANSFTWNSTSVGSSLTVSPTTTTTYSVVGKTSEGCLFDASSTVYVSACTNLNSLNENELVKIYPVPAKDFIELNISNQELVSEFNSASIYNSVGLLLKEEEIFFINSSLKIKIEDLPNGVYSLQLKSSTNETLSKRFVISR
jgi:hypothetical protein